MNITFLVAPEFPGGYGSTSLHGHRVLIVVDEDLQSRGANPGELRPLTSTSPIIGLSILPIPDVFVIATENSYYFTYVNSDPESKQLSPFAITRTPPIKDYLCQCRFLNVNVDGDHSKKIIGPIKSVENIEGEGCENVYLVEDCDGKTYVLGVIK